jgi:cellulose synthase operon protein C
MGTQRDSVRRAMDPREIEALVQRLVANPHDQEALAYAHQAGASDPKGYAILLERVGTNTQDPAYASHWLSEAANVWSIALGDAHSAARVLMLAIEKDPTQEVAADRLAQLYRERGEHRSLAALLERRVKAMAPLAVQNQEIRTRVATLCEELGRLWSEPPLAQPKKALEHFRRTIEFDPRNMLAIYSAREIYKQLRLWAEAIPLFDMEQALVDDPERKAALYRDESMVRREAGDGAGATQVLRHARHYQPEDPALMQELGSLVLDRIKNGEVVSAEDRAESAALFVSMAESYGGEHGVAYSIAALEAEPGNDRAIQLAAYFGNATGQTAELPARWSKYLEVNPNGPMAEEARVGLAAAGGYTAPPESALPSMPDSQGGSGRQSDPMQAFPMTPESSAEQPLPHAPEEPAQDSGNAVQSMPSSPEQVAGLLDAASQAASKGNKAGALSKYKEVLVIEPANPEGLAWVKDHYRQKRMYGDLKEVLTNAARYAHGDERKGIWRDLAGLCEQQLRDMDGAIYAFKQLLALDRSETSAAEALRRLLEKSSRWDELATLLEEEAMSEPDVETKMALEKKLAQLHETKRKDVVAAGEAWSRIANLTPDDEQAVWTAVKLFEKGDRLDFAAQTISDNVASIEDVVAKSKLLLRLAEIREESGDFTQAADVFAEAAVLTENAKTWEQAQKLYEKAQRWLDAAHALDQQAELSGEPKVQADLYARAAQLIEHAGDADMSLLKWEQACQLDPTQDTFAEALEARYQQLERFADIALLLVNRAEHSADKEKRVGYRRRAAKIQREQLDNMELARETLLKLLEDGDDEEALLLLANDAEEREDFFETVELLKRLEGTLQESSRKTEVLMREATLLAQRIEDPEGAIARYERLLAELDPKHRGALEALAALEEQRANYKGAAGALERLVPTLEGEEKTEIACKLATMYEEQLSDDRGAIRAWEIVVANDEEDFNAVSRLCDLCKKVEDWTRTAQLMRLEIEVEGDDEEISAMSRELAQILAEKLEKGDEALAVLQGPADVGDVPCQQAYITLGDSLGWHGIVATKLVIWNENRPLSPERNEGMRAAFDRFLKVGRHEEAARVAIDLARSKGADEQLARELEGLAKQSNNLDALETAHDLLVAPMNGLERAEELVRQAEVRVEVGVDRVDAIQHGELGLASISPEEAEELLNRLAAMADTDAGAIDVFERQVMRAKNPSDRIRAFARAAQVASQRNSNDRAKSFFDMALAGGVHDDILETLEQAASEADGENSTQMRSLLAEAFSTGGQGARDGGRTRCSLLRRAAHLAQNDLGDTDRAFRWMGDALCTHVDQTTLDALEALGQQIGDMKRVESTLSRALSEVFDGPLVRQLLAARAHIRRDCVQDREGAAQDLKKLHDLSPSDADVMDELSTLLTELGDYRGMVQVLEDQILRGKNQSARAELARRVAQLWEEHLADPREAADAWRRVLRMKSGDPEAQAGLERAKTNMLKKPDPVTANALSPLAPLPVANHPASSAKTPVAAVVPMDPDATSPGLSLPEIAAKDADSTTSSSTASVPSGDHGSGNQVANSEPNMVPTPLASPVEEYQAPGYDLPPPTSFGMGDTGAPPPAPLDISSFSGTADSGPIAKRPSTRPPPPPPPRTSSPPSPRTGFSGAPPPVPGMFGGRGSVRPSTPGLRSSDDETTVSQNVEVLARSMEETDPDVMTTPGATFPLSESQGNAIFKNEEPLAAPASWPVEPVAQTFATEEIEAIDDDEIEDVDDAELIEEIEEIDDDKTPPRL